MNKCSLSYSTTIALSAINLTFWDGACLTVIADWFIDILEFLFFQINELC